MQRTSASSSKIRILGSQRPSYDRAGPARLEEQILGRQAVDEYRRTGERSLRSRLQNMEAEHRETLEHLQGLAEDDDFDVNNIPAGPTLVNMDGVLDGSERIELSHAGGEFGAWEDDIEEAADATETHRTRGEDWRTRCDRTEQELPMRQGPEGPALDSVEEIYSIQVVDMFDFRNVDVKLDPRGNRVAAALIMEGLMPFTHVRCPQLAIQPFVKALCDMHGVPYKPYLCQQFLIAYDLYLDIRRHTDEQVMASLRRRSTWRLKHTCPVCMYKLEGEEKLIFDMLTTMDGNDSLKRVLRHTKTTNTEEDGEPALGPSKERIDNRDAGDGYFISHEKVEEWAKTRLADALPMQPDTLTRDNPCADRWKNMINNITSKMWGIFDETGIFLALCRHGFVLVITDMLRSGELAKYPLAIVKELLDAFGMDLGAGYDVGCHFEVTVANSELGNLAREKNLRCLVGAFHGHAHNRLCQLGFLATYVEGLGLEDLEGCERFFSRSNRLAKSCRYASRFHRQQEITTYVKHFDSFETYCEPGEVPLLKLPTSAHHPEDRASACKLDAAGGRGMQSFDEFKQWLQEEKDYLLGLKNAPKENVETLEMEYVQKLINLSASETKYAVLAANARRARSDDAVYVPGVAKAELARRHGIEKMEKDLDAKWASTVVEVKKRKYQLALDELELLIVERIFELMKMNQSQTGYKLRKHITKALQARSKAVRNTIDRYNSV
ncbi:hypothetical protein FB451DRAFT_1436491 [Mycena latifolia]|nr:hypothetical protein FB451DRAFT_1436491 [Mycena latifolia]